MATADPWPRIPVGQSFSSGNRCANQGARGGKVGLLEDFRTGRNVFSRGGLMAAEMDDRIATRSAGRKSLKDALRHLVAWSARERRAFEVNELPRLFQEATGVDTKDILERWLRPQ